MVLVKHECGRNDECINGFIFEHECERNDE